MFQRLPAALAQVEAGNESKIKFDKSFAPYIEPKK